MKKFKGGARPLDPINGKMTKRLALWMHKMLFDQLKKEAKESGIDIRAHARVKLGAKIGGKG